jgi:hypothetical protein
MPGKCGTLLRVRFTEGLGVDEAIVLGVCADPEPVDAGFAGQAKCPVVQPHFCAVQLAAAQQLELQGRVRWVPLEELEVLVRQRSHLCR